MTTKRGKLKLKVVEEHSQSKEPSILTATPSVVEEESSPQTMAVSQDGVEIGRELANRADIEANESEYSYLYPVMDDPQFNVKIAERKEFFDTRYDGTIHPVEEEADKLCNAEFELAPHQLFVRNFLSFQTPYNSLLLYHGLGSGKTCSAISVAEEMRDYLKQMGIVQRIIVVASPNVQENFKLQLFDDRKLQLVDGLWNIRACTGNKFLKEINPMSMKGLSKDKVVSQIRRIINSAYLFLGYIEFANYINKKSNVGSEVEGSARKSALLKQKLKKHFNNRLIIIDEVHNIRITDDNKDKRVAVELFKLVQNVDHLRLLLLSATPMYNSYKEIVWLVNLMNMNDKRTLIEAKDVFNTDGSFKQDSEGREIGKELLERKATGYVSFVRGENPYTFPYRIWPKEFAKDRTFAQNEVPRLQLNGRPLVQNLEMLSIYLTEAGAYQQRGYDYIITRMEQGDFNVGRARQMPSFENMEAFGYTLLQKPLESLNIVYPDDRLEEEGTQFDSRDLVGKTGLSRIMKSQETVAPPARFNFEYRSAKYGRIFSPQEIGKYSGKIKNICDRVVNSKGVVLVYSQYIDGGLVPIALALEELGFTRAGTVKSLFKTPPTEKIDALTFKPQSQVDSDFNPAKYVMITGDKALSPDNVADLKMLTNVDNKEGASVKVVLISQAGSEGLDFKFIRQVHVLEPWYNMNRIEQIIGRAVRTCSHKDLPFIQRNVELYLYGSLMQDRTREAADIYVYRLAELKAIQIGAVSRVLKEVSVDCLLNFEQMGFTVEQMKQTVTQELSSGGKIKYAIGDRPYTATCDYMSKCAYTCRPSKNITDADVKLDTFSEAFIMMNTDKIVHRIRMLMKDKFFYRKPELIARINVVKQYPLVQINAALNQMVEDKNEFITDKYGRLGNLVNISDLYLYQPLELNNDHVSVYDRSVPVEFKRAALDFNLPDKVSEAIMKPADKGDNLHVEQAIENIREMRENYALATEEQIIVRGDDNWYKFCSLVIKDMSADGIPMATLLDFLVAHILDEARFVDKIAVLNYLEGRSRDEFEEKLYAYFTSRVLTHKGIRGILFQNTGKQQLIVAKGDERVVWSMAEGEDYQDLAPKIAEIAERLLPAKSKLNEFVGFMVNFKKDYMVFKVKNMTKKRHTGARCDQAGKGDAVRTLNAIIGENKYSVDDDISQKQICVLQEFTLRLFDKEKKDGKVWYLNPAEAVLIDVPKLNF